MGNKEANRVPWHNALRESLSHCATGWLGLWSLTCVGCQPTQWNCLLCFRILVRWRGHDSMTKTLHSVWGNSSTEVQCLYSDNLVLADPQRRVNFWAKWMGKKQKPTSLGDIWKASKLHKQTWAVANPKGMNNSHRGRYGPTLFRLGINDLVQISNFKILFTYSVAIVFSKTCWTVNMMKCCPSQIAYIPFQMLSSF